MIYLYAQNGERWVGVGCQFQEAGRLQNQRHAVLIDKVQQFYSSEEHKENEDHGERFGVTCIRIYSEDEEKFVHTLASTFMMGRKTIILDPKRFPNPFRTTLSLLFPCHDDKMKNVFHIISN